MNDHELNEAMARLCGITMLSGDCPIGPYPCVGCDGVLHTSDDNACECQDWGPANNWQQVHKYVIPAIRERDCDVNILHSSNLGDSVEITKWDSAWQMPDEDLCHRAAPRGERLTPRLVCEAILGAREKLEAAK